MVKACRYWAKALVVTLQVVRRAPCPGPLRLATTDGIRAVFGAVERPVASSHVFAVNIA